MVPRYSSEWIQYYDSGTPIWTNTASTGGDYFLATSSTEGYGTVELLAHSTATGAQSWGVSDSNANGYAFGSFAGVGAAWSPAAPVGRIIRLIGGIRLRGGVRLGGSSPVP